MKNSFGWRTSPCSAQGKMRDSIMHKLVCNINNTSSRSFLKTRLTTWRWRSGPELGLQFCNACSQGGTVLLLFLPHVPPVHKVGTVETSSSLHSISDTFLISRLPYRSSGFYRVAQFQIYVGNSFEIPLDLTWQGVHELVVCGHKFKSVYTRSVNVAFTSTLRPHTLVDTVLRSSNLLMYVVLRYYYYWSGHRCSSGVPQGLMRSQTLVL